jgi:hypothetical protein
MMAARATARPAGKLGPVVQYALLAAAVLLPANRNVTSFG